MKKLVILDLSKDYKFLVNDAHIFQLSFGLPKLKQVKFIEKNFFSEIKFKKFRLDINKKLNELLNRINKYQEQDLVLLEIFNSRNDKIQMYNKIFYLQEIIRYIREKKIKNCKIISDDNSFFETYRSIKIKNLELDLINKSNNNNNFFFYLKKTTLFFIKTFLFLTALKLFSKKEKIKKYKEACLSIYPQYFKNKINKFYDRNLINLNFQITDETHLSNSLLKNICQIFETKKINNLIQTEKFISFKDLLINFYISLKRIKYIKKMNKHKVELNNLNLTNQFKYLFLYSLLNFNKLKIYENALKKILYKYKFKKFHYYLFEYNFGYFLANLFNKNLPSSELIGYQHGIYSERLMWQDFIKTKNFKNFSPNKIICKYQLSFNEYKKNFKKVNIKKRYSKLVFKSKSKPYKKYHFNVFLGLHDCFQMINELRKKNFNKLFYLNFHPKFKNKVSLLYIKNLIFKFKKLKKLNFIKLLSPSSTIPYQLHKKEDFFILNPKYMIPLNPKKFDRYEFKFRKINF